MQNPNMNSFAELDADAPLPIVVTADAQENLALRCLLRQAVLYLHQSVNEGNPPPGVELYFFTLAVQSALEDAA